MPIQLAECLKKTVGLVIVIILPVCDFASFNSNKFSMLDQFLDYSPNFGADMLLLLPILVALEAVLSADNAIALAAIAQGLDGSKLQRQALNLGLVAAFVLRVGLILTATWVTKFWQFEFLGAAYLLWLVFQHFTSEDVEEDTHQHHGPKFSSLWQAIPTIALTDLAFSLDSVTTAIALSQEIWLIIIGGLIGIIALRFMAELFIRWLDEYVHLEDAGYITVALVGVRLLLKAANLDYVIPEWLMVGLIASLFIWGFSRKKPIEAIEISANTDPSEEEIPESEQEKVVQ